MSALIPRPPARPVRTRRARVPKQHRRSGRPCAPGSCPSSSRKAADPPRRASRSPACVKARALSRSQRRTLPPSMAICTPCKMPVMTHDVLDRRRDDRLAAREIFRRLGRRDELGRIVHREGHQRHVPARQVGRQLLVGLADRGNGCCAAAAGLRRRSSRPGRPSRTTSRGACRGHLASSSMSKRSSITP